MMRPEDDASWPVCGGKHSDSNLGSGKHWCGSVRQYLLDNEDAGSIERGLRYCVPVVPSENWYAEVSIGTEVIGGISARLFLIKEDSPFASTEIEIPLGLWTEGEGRMSIASTLSGWIDAQQTEKCEWSGHGFEQEMKFQALMRSADERGKKVNRWCLAYYGCCSICWASRDVAQQGAQTWNASSFGLDPNQFNTTGQGTSRQQTILQQVQQKYGQRQMLGHSPINFYEQPVVKSPSQRAWEAFND